MIIASFSIVLCVSCRAFCGHCVRLLDKALTDKDVFIVISFKFCCGSIFSFAIIFP